jgi:hypothetical protein
MTVKATSNKIDGSAIHDFAILPFRKDEGGPTKLTKENSVTLELLVNPTDDTSAKVKINVWKVAGTESPHETLQWFTDLQHHIFPGMGLLTGAAQRAVLNTVASGNTHIIMARISLGCSTQECLKRANAANPEHRHG